MNNYFLVGITVLISAFGYDASQHKALNFLRYDFNGDGVVDVAVLDREERVRIELGRKDGSFERLDKRGNEELFDDVRARLLVDHLRGTLDSTIND
jgi:hypothetical protein